MNRKQRRERLKKLHENAKAAKRAKRDGLPHPAQVAALEKAALEALNAAQPGAGRAAAEPQGLAESRGTPGIGPADAPESQTPQQGAADTGEDARATTHARDAHATVQAAQDTVTAAKAAVAVADLAETPGTAKNMLWRAARAVDALLEVVHKTIEQVPANERAEALVIMKQPRETQPQPGKPQQRPRAGYNPVLTLMRMGLQLANLQQRIIGRLYPNLAKQVA